MRFLVYTLLLSLLYLGASAQPVLLNDPNQTYRFFQNSVALADKSGNVTIDSLLRYPRRYAFVPIRQAALPSALHRPYWFKVDLTNPTLDNYFLRFFMYSDLVVRVYEVDKNRVLQHWQVDFYGVSTTDLFQRSRAILPLRLGQGQTHSLYFYVDHMDMATLHVGAMSSQMLAKEIHYQDLFNGLFCGIILLIATYSLLLGVQLGDRDNLLYAIWIIVTGLQLASNAGIVLELPGNWVFPLKHNYGVVLGFIACLRIALTLSFLQIKQRARWLYRLGLVQIGVAMLGAVGLLCAYAVMTDDREWQKNMATLVSFSSVVFDVLAGIVVWFRQRYRPALFFIFGVICAFLASLLFVGSLYGALPMTFWALNSLYIGYIGEIIFFLLGLTYKINLLKKNQEEAVRQQLRLSEENRQLIESQKQELEQKIDARTAELRASQARLIQKEKLASLGELTAGIAHEIQNPLNFVNNFSEVSTELVIELEEEQQKINRDTDLEADLLVDLKQNLQKITHHGKRAGAIVKGMLEHSRASTGERTPTDLNALADEYLRLAYHGLLRSEGRTPGDPAKDESANYQLITNFATDLPSVSVVAQDIGRVLLNLYNNAFYAVHERSSQAPDGYEPTVWVSSYQVNSHIEIRVRDNGAGIAEAIQAKIFQPFFTTKPTGEGTGLGLSLSYDIVTRGHNGSLIVESEEGAGTEFVIRLPF